MTNIQAHQVPSNQHASLLSGSAGAHMFMKLQQKVRPGRPLEPTQANDLINRHFVVAVYGESTTKLAAAAALILPERGLAPFEEQLKEVDIPTGSAILCLAAYSTKLMGIHRHSAEDRLMAGARLLAQGSGYKEILVVGGQKAGIFEVWKRAEKPCP